VNDRAAFVHWERTEFIPYLRSERQKEILGAIEPLRIEGLEQWNGTQKELAVKARELYENKQYPSLRAACRAMCRQYTIEGRLIKTESLYTQAKESQGKPMV
jgi:hypothetical protein